MAEHEIPRILGLVQFERLDELTDTRAAIAAQYDTAFAECDLLNVPPRRLGDHRAWHLYLTRLRLEALKIDRAEVIRRLGAAGIGSSVHFIPLHLDPWYPRGFGYRPGDLPVAEHLYECSIFLPIWPGMGTDQVAPVAEALLTILGAARRAVEA